MMTAPILNLDEILILNWCSGLSMVIGIKISEIISINKKKKKIHNNNNKEREILSIIYRLLLWNWKLLKTGPKKMNFIRLNFFQDIKFLV